MQHEFLKVLTDKGVNFLLVRRRAEGRNHQCLGFTSRKQRRSVSPRQHFDLAGDGANVL